MHAYRADRPVRLREGLTMRHDPIYDADNLERWELWLLRIISAAMAITAGAITFRLVLEVLG